MAQYELFWAPPASVTAHDYNYVLVDMREDVTKPSLTKYLENTSWKEVLEQVDEALRQGFIEFVSRIFYVGKEAALKSRINDHFTSAEKVMPTQHCDKRIRQIFDETGGCSTIFNCSIVATSHT